MKTHLYKYSLSAIILISVTMAAKAQNANVSSQPLWGPTGYQQADYYYLPDVQTYYSVASRQFIFLNNGRWLYAAGLPAQYKNYDLYSGYKVVINRPRPFLNFSQDKILYAKFKGKKHKQISIREAHETNSHLLPAIIKN